MSGETALTHEFLRVSRRELRTDLNKIEKAVSKLTEEQIWSRRHEQENSVGNLLLHLAGNVRQWIIAGVGDAPDQRDRDAEFAQRERLPTDQLLKRLRQTIEEADAVLVEAESRDLLEKRHVQVFDLTLMQMIYHCVEHFSGHTGQIIWIAKNACGEDMGFYRYLQNPDLPPDVQP